VDRIKEHPFFVVMGVVVLVALALFFVLVEPMKRANAAKLAQVAELSNRLQRLMGDTAKDKDKTKTRDKDKVVLPNQVTMAAAQGVNARYAEETDKVLDRVKEMNLLKDMNKVLAPLTSIDVDEAVFKVDYADNVKALMNRVLNKGINTPAGTWNFWDWGETMPSSRIQRELAAKEFVILAELVDIIELSELSVKVVERLEVNPGIARSGSYVASRTRERVGDYFDVFPFVISVHMDLAKRELLVRELLKSELPIFIRTVSMQRVPQDKALYGRNTPPVYVGVRITGWVLDYSPLPPETVAETGGMRPMPR
jgi:hypothetical protein